MKNISCEEFAKKLYELYDDEIIDIIDSKLKKVESLDITFIYIYIKAFILHLDKVYLENINKLDKFNNLYIAFKISLEEHYKNNNLGITSEILEQILDAFDKSFEFIESINITKDIIMESYELRHYLIDALELLRIILMKKSKANIRSDLFENIISPLKNYIDEILIEIEKYNLN